MKYLKLLDSLVTGICKFFLMSSMALMFILVFINVVARYLFEKSWSSFEEITIFLMIWITWVGAGLALREGKLVAFDVLQDQISPTARKLLRIFIAIILAFTAIIFFWYGYKYCLRVAKFETNVLQISRAYPYASIPVGAAFFLFQLLISLPKFLNSDWESMSDDMVEGAE